MVQTSLRVLVSGALAFGQAPASPQPGVGVPVLDDSLQGATTGTRSGGQFVAGGWQVTGKNDTIYWQLPQARSTWPQGVGGEDPRDAAATYGKECLEQSVEVVRQMFAKAGLL